MKEPFFLSVRFWISVLTPILAVALAPVIVAVSAATGVPDELVRTVLSAAVGSLIVMAATFVIARTLRNTPTNPK